jgi:predicted nucleotide-binding protein (sugar kinase/HSP70/actin superfamily)
MTETEATNVINFQSLFAKVGQFNLRNKTFLIPEMNRNGCHLLAGTLRGFGINARILETYKGLDLGKEFTSGKECFPCQVTLGDILHFIREEKAKLGDDFNPEEYVYFMPEATGPCRFGMYNKYQRIVLDSFPELEKLKIGSLTTGNSYSLEGMIEDDQAQEVRKVAYFCVIVGDILDRLLWRIRPYEKETGMADGFIENAMTTLSEAFEICGVKNQFDRIIETLEHIIIDAGSVVDPNIPLKPLIGIVGEIYLRTHVHANQDLIRVLEKYGAEVVNASISEWVDFTAYENMRAAQNGCRLNLKQFRLNKLKENLKEVINYRLTLRYQHAKQDQIYTRVNRHLALAKPHQVSHLDKILKEKDIYSFDIGTEACLSIAGILEYIRDGFNGVVNVYPFTCMPSTITSAIMKPSMNRMKIPYLDTPYDGSSLPGRESAIRTFMYQAEQHFKRNGGNIHR